MSPGLPGAARCKVHAYQFRRLKRSQVQSQDLEDPLEEGMATYSSILAWRIPWTEEPSGRRPRGSQRVDTTEVT